MEENQHRTKESHQARKKSAKGDRKRNQMAPWSKEDTREFIKLIEAHECIWNVNNDSFKEKFSRAAAWDIVSQTRGRQEMDCLAKWNSLRTNYRVSFYKHIFVYIFVY